MMRVKAPKKGARLTSTAGVAISLAPGEIREIPDFLAEAAQAQGCLLDVPVDMPDPEVTREKVRETLRQLIAEGDPASFTPTRRAKVSVVRERSGVDISVTDMNELFDEVMREHDST